MYFLIYIYTVYVCYVCVGSCIVSFAMVPYSIALELQLFNSEKECKPLAGGV